MKLKAVPLKEWRERVLKGEAPEDGLLIKGYNAIVEVGGDVGERKAAFTISTGAVDRDGDVVAVAGWDLAPYRENPVVLWGHDASIPPIGKSEKTWVASGALKSVCAFPEAGVYGLADTVQGLVKGGFLRGTSVGFHPVAFEPRKGESKGIAFNRHELYEYSILPIPSNREALADAKGLGIDIAPVLKWAEQFIEEADEGLMVVRKDSLKDALSRVMPTSITVPDLAEVFKANAPALVESIKAALVPVAAVVVPPSTKAAGADASAAFSPEAIKGIRAMQMLTKDTYVAGQWTDQPVTTGQIIDGRDAREAMCELEFALMDSLRSIMCDAEPGERAGLIQTSVDEFVSRYVEAAAMLPDLSDHEKSAGGLIETAEGFGFVDPAPVKLVLFKAGKVLASRNEARFRLALANLHAILAEIEDKKDEIAPPVGPDKAGRDKQTPKGLNLAEAEAIFKDVDDKDEIEKSLAEEFGFEPEVLRAQIKEAFQREKMQLTGRLPD